MNSPARPIGIIFSVAIVALALSLSGCSNPFSGPAPSVTVIATYAPPTPTPYPVESPTPTPSASSWNGYYVKLYGNVTANGGDHVYGTIKIYYLDEEFWDEHPTVQYDTQANPNYSLDIRANVTFIPELGYYYYGRLPPEMLTKRMDKMTITNDTRLDFSVMTSNITPIN